MGFVTGLLTIFPKHNATWGIIDRLTKSAHFILVKIDFPLAKLNKVYIKKVVKLHGVPSNIVSEKDHGSLRDFELAYRRLWV